jgi:hypothetical protein
METPDQSTYEAARLRRAADGDQAAWASIVEPRCPLRDDLEGKGLQREAHPR